MSLEGIYGADTVLGDLLDRASAEHARRIAVSDPEDSWTYAELAGHSARFARRLRSEGVRAGDRVAIEARSDRWFVAALYGCLKTGAVTVPLNVGLAASQVERVLADAGPSLLLADAWAVSERDGLRVRPAPSSWHGEPANAGPGGLGAPVVSPGALALLMYTSGSSGPLPKAVMSLHAQAVFAVEQIARRLRYRSDDIVYCRLPLSFDYGLYQIFLAAVAGAELVLRGPAIDAALFADVKRTGATVLPLVPTLASMLVRLATRDRARTSLRLVTNTGEELHRSAIEDLRNRFPGLGIQLMFGITECKRVSIMEVDGDLDRPGSVGRPLDGTEVVVVDGEGRPVPPGVEGEIVVRGPHVMNGYWRDPVASAAVFRDSPGTGRQLHTGDYGFLDAEGYLYFLGRRDQQFKRMATRTSTMEIEAAALRVEGVSEAVVLPPTKDRDAVLLVAADLDPAAVLSRLRGFLEPQKTPSLCEVKAALPHNGNGKIDRVRLRAEFDAD